jgi:sterol O-acyltransferase
MAESSSIETRARDGQGELLSPRPRKPTRIDLLKPQLNDDIFNKDGTLKEPGSGVSSGRTTPIPADAPPDTRTAEAAHVP